MKFIIIILLFVVFNSCSSSKDNYFYRHYYFYLSEYNEKVEFKNPKFEIRFSISSYFGNFPKQYYFYCDDTNYYYKKYDYKNEIISVRQIDSIRFNEIKFSLNWLTNFVEHIERDSYSFDNDYDYGMSYQLLLNDNNNHKLALIFNKSDSKDQGKEHDYSIMLIKSLILEAELFPELYDKVIKMEDVFPTDSIYKEYKRRWE